jgi:hypothetical protein
MSTATKPATETAATQSPSPLSISLANALREDKGPFASANDGRYRRTTIALSPAIDQNLSLLVARAGTTKSQYISHLIRKDLIAKGLSPDIPPKDITISY